MGKIAFLCIKNVLQLIANIFKSPLFVGYLVRKLTKNACMVLVYFVPNPGAYIGTTTLPLKLQSSKSQQ